MSSKLIVMLDKTLGIYKDSRGFYLFDSFDGSRSMHFKNEKAARRYAEENELIDEGEL